MTESVSESENPAIPSPTPKRTRPRTNKDWWPNQLDLSVLHQHSPLSNPMGEDFNYAEEFKTLDVEALKRDLIEVMTTSQDWWPADYGHYGPLFIRMTWHAAGTYRIADGRGGGGEGAQRFAPLNSWPDNANLDKARRLLWPIKQKYGRKISWADLLVFAGNVAMESMGFKTFGFGFGRPDIWEPEEIFWGPEDTWLGDERHGGDGRDPGALRRRSHGPDLRESRRAGRQPGPAAWPRSIIRETFAPHGDERRGDGRAHRRRPHVRQDPRRGAGGRARRPGARGRPPRGARPRLEEQLTAAARAATRSPAGSRAPGPTTPTKWDNGFLENLYNYDWELTTSPAGAKQWTPKNPEAPGHRAGCARSVEAARADDADDGPGAEGGSDLRADREALPRASGPAGRRLRQGLVQAAAPRHGPGLALPRPVGSGAAAVAGPRPRGRSRTDRRAGHRRPQGQDPRVGTVHLASWSPPPGRRRPASAAPTSAAAPTARASASRRRRTGRSTSRPSWPRRCRRSSRSSRTSTRSQSGGKKVSLADLIVLGGCAAVEQAAKNAGHDVTVPFAPGRTDASQEQTDVESFAVLEPTFDGFRNYLQAGELLSPETLLVERAYMLTLTAPR